MTAILGYTDLLINDPEMVEDSTRRGDALKTIARNGEHLLGIINDILDLSKIEDGKLTVERSRCSPASLIEEAVAFLQGERTTNVCNSSSTGRCRRPRRSSPIRCV